MGRGAVHAPGESLPGVEAQGAAHQGPGVAERGEALGVQVSGGGDGDLQHGQAALGLRGPILGVAQHPALAQGVGHHQGGAALVQHSWQQRVRVLYHYAVITFAAGGTVDVEHHDGGEGQLGPRGQPLELGQVLGALGPQGGQRLLVQLGARLAGVEGDHHLLHVGGPLDVALYLCLHCFPDLK